MSNSKDFLLMNLLDCGSYDLKLIEDVGYNWYDIFDFDFLECLYEFKVHNYKGRLINFILEQVILYGIDQIQIAIDNRICELEAIPNERELDADEEEELTALRTLTPMKDMSYYCNCLDTHVWIDKHVGTYREYLSDALDDFTDNTGFEFEEGEE